MADIEVSFARQEANSSSTQSSRETLINMFAQPEISARNAVTIRQRPGLTSIQALAGEKRCIEKHRGNHYVIVGDQLYRFDGALTVLGTLNTDVGRCTMVFNDNDQILISDGLTGYVYDGSLSVLSAPQEVGHVATISGFGVFSVPNSDRFYSTALNDFTSVDALDFATAEGSPDTLRRVFVDHNQLWMFGTQTIEIWDLSGNAIFPFSRFTNAQMTRGTKAAFSIVSEDNSIFWLGDDLLVYRAEGYRPVAVSNSSVARLIENVPEAAQELADAFIYTFEGEKFYVLRFPGYLSIQINVRTGAWSLCKTFDNPDWRVAGSAGYSSEYLLTDAGLAKLDSTVSTDEGVMLERGGISAPVTADGRKFSVAAFFLDAEVGRAGEGVNSQVMLRTSYDSETFGNEMWRDLGLIGAYKTRTIWRKLGAGREITFELMITDPVQFKIMSTRVKIKANK